MVTLSRAGLSDAAALLDTKIEAFSGDVSLYGYGPPGYDSLDDISRALVRPGNHYYKIMADSQLAGGLCAQELGGGHFHLNSIYVFAAYQNRGTGSEAMRLLFASLPQARRWTLETPYLSFRNHHFYEKLGFIKTGETMPESDGFHLFLHEKRDSAQPG